MEIFPRAYVPADNAGSAAIVVLSWVFPTLATFSVAARFSARRLRRAGFALDDWLILLSLPVVWGHTAIILASVYIGGIGHHEIQLGLQNEVALYQTLTALQFSFGVSLGLIKASIILLLMRIFFTRPFKLAARIVLGYICCWTFMTVLIGACMCRPFALNWDPTIPGHCGQRIPAYIAIAALDIFGDILILALPMPMIWNLHASMSNKVGLSFVFALGILDIVVGILRIIYLVALNTAVDYTWVAVNCWIWSVLEPSLAVIVACGPTFGPLIAACLGHVRTTKTSSSNQHPSYPSNSRQQFSNISETEYPLQPMYGSTSIAECKGAALAPATGEVPPSMDDVERKLRNGGADMEPGRNDIRVVQNISVLHSPHDLPLQKV